MSTAQTNAEVVERKEMKAVWWIKRDFRISDNHCLWSASKNAKMVIPFFCWEESVLNEGDYSSFHFQAQWEGLSGLTKSLQKRGVGYRVVIGEIVEQLELLFSKMPFDQLYSHQETGNLLTFRRDKAVQSWCAKVGVDWIEKNPSSVIRGGSAHQRRLKSKNADFRKQVPLKIPELRHLHPLPDDIIREGPDWKKLTSIFTKFRGLSYNSNLCKVDERSAFETLDSFLNDRGIEYSGGISSPNTAFENGSRLSSHLAWGTMSLCSVFNQLDKRREELLESDDRRKWNRSLRAFESRLYWRDHFIQRLESFPELEEKALNSAYADLKYEDEPDNLQAWIKGETGYPMVDACMRCLAHTGFLNFRMRAMVVSFACYGLHLSWKTIHQPLAQMFHDYEPGIHLSQLQMQAGIVGFNAIRVYSPSKQFLDHDPEGRFVKRWIPELEKRTTAEIANAENSIMHGYSPILVDLKSRAKEMKSRIFEIRKSVGGKIITDKVLKKHGSRKPIKKKRKGLVDNKRQMTLFKTFGSGKT